MHTHTPYIGLICLTFLERWTWTTPRRSTSWWTAATAAGSAAGCPRARRWGSWRRGCDGTRRGRRMACWRRMSRTPTVEQWMVANSNSPVDGWWTHPTLDGVSTCFNHPVGGAGFRNHPQKERFWLFRPKHMRNHTIVKTSTSNPESVVGYFRSPDKMDMMTLFAAITTFMRSRLVDISTSFTADHKRIPQQP